jgi:tether containing UBX domain for GLUT4
LSCPIRLSGLSSGAKLELVRISQSPSPVSVALQIPNSEVSDPSKARLTGKFPSTTSLWIVLRKFESDTPSLNFTARGTPLTTANLGAAGRLFYESPVIQIMGRELSSFTDMQMTLRDLGYNSGSVLLRLSFKLTEKPLEEAMLEISRYFKDVENTQAASRSLSGDVAGSSSVGNAVGSQGNSREVLAFDAKPNDEIGETRPIGEEGSGLGEPDVSADENALGPEQRQISIYAPSSNSTPQAATCKSLALFLNLEQSLKLIRRLQCRGL